MKQIVFFIILGYLMGSIRFAYWVPRLFFQKDIYEISPDHNPGTANVYMNCGFFAGTFVLLCDLAKGFLPVFLASQRVTWQETLFGVILAAPVLGHAFPFHHWRQGGKAIAVSFGVLLGLYPLMTPAFALAFCYLFFSLLVVIRPHLFRSVATFGLFVLIVALMVEQPAVRLGCVGVALVVIGKHLHAYQKEKIQITLCH